MLGAGLPPPRQPASPRAGRPAGEKASCELPLGRRLSRSRPPPPPGGGSRRHRRLRGRRHLPRRHLLSTVDRCGRTSHAPHSPVIALHPSPGVAPPRLRPTPPLPLTRGDPLRADRLLRRSPRRCGRHAQAHAARPAPLPSALPPPPALAVVFIPLRVPCPLFSSLDAHPRRGFQSRVWVWSRVGVEPRGGSPTRSRESADKGRNSYIPA